MPATGVTAVILNLVAVVPASPGFLTVWPASTARPLASSLNFAGGQIAANLVTVKLGAGGKVSIYNGSGSTVHLVADVAGWYGVE